MAQVKLLKIHTNGVPVEFDSVNDDITLKSFTATTGGPVLSATGLNNANQDITNLKNIVFADPTTDTINQTAGALIVDNIMAKDRNNVMASTGAVLFSTVTNTAAQLDSFKLPDVAGAPSATPAFSSTGGYMVYDSTNKALYIWDGTVWDSFTSDIPYTAAVTIAARDAVYINAADNVTPAVCTADTTSQVVGFATAGTAAAGQVNIKSSGALAGFTGLTAGSRYYLGGTAGTISTTVPSASGNSIVQVGYAKNATTLNIQIQQLGRRA